MPTDDTQQTPAQDTDDIVIPTGSEIYDSLMSQIEPELVQANLDFLDEPYADETEEERKARYKRYSEAFVKYREAFALWSGELSKSIDEYKKAVRAAAEEVDKEDQINALQGLEAQISTL